MWSKPVIGEHVETHEHYNKGTLDQLSDDGENLLFKGKQLSSGGGGDTIINADGRTSAIFSLRGGRIDTRRQFRGNSVYYSFPPIDANRGRRLFVWKPDGGRAWVEIPDGVLAENEGLIYNMTDNLLIKRSGTWGNIAVSENEYLLLYNTLGILGGELSKYCVNGEDSVNIPVKELEMELVKSSGSTQGIFIVGDRLFVSAHSNDEHTDFSTFGTSLTWNGATTINMTHNFGHMNAPSYSAAKDSLIVGNGSKSYSLLPKGWIIPNFESLLVHGGVLDFNAVEKIELDFTHLTGEAKCQLCWGYDSTDVIYMFTDDNTVLRKITLGKGSENLGMGVFVSGKTESEYNGSYVIDGEWRSRTEDVLGGMTFHKGFIYTGVKGDYGIRKCIPLSSGYFDSEYIQVADKRGDMQGLAVREDKLYAFTDYRGYSVNLSDIS